MKVKDIQNAIRGMQPDDDLNLCIRVRDTHYIGGTPTVGVSSLMWGFDWDTGKLIITPSEELYKTSKKKINK